MSTYATMQARIADELVRDDLSSQIRSAIQTAVQMWEGTRFSFNEGRFHLTTVTNQESYLWSAMTYADDDSLLDDNETMLEVDSITILYGGTTYPLCERTIGWLNDTQVPSEQYIGVPSDFVVYADKLLLAPIPQDAYTLTLNGLYRLPALVLDADANAWMTEGEALIRNQAKVLIMQDVIRDEGGIALAERSLGLALKSLERKSSAKTMTGRIAAWGG